MAKDNLETLNRITALETLVATLQTGNTAQAAINADFEDRITDLEEAP